MNLLAAAKTVVESTGPVELTPMNWPLAIGLLLALSVLVTSAVITEARK